MAWTDSIAKALNQAFEDTYPESFMEDWSPMEHYLGKDYQRHLFNTSAAGGVGGYGLDYNQNRLAGESSNEAFKGTTDQAGKSAAILAAIFGGSSLLGGGEGGGGVNAGGLELDQGPIMGGEGGGGFNWQQFAQQGLGNIGDSSGQAAETQRQQSFDTQGRALDQLAEAIERKRREEAMRQGTARPIY